MINERIRNQRSKSIYNSVEPTGDSPEILIVESFDNY